MKIERAPLGWFSSRLEVSGLPPSLYFLGDPSPLRARCLTLVGTRRPSPCGLRAAFRFGRELARAGFTIVSGLARGVDTRSHEGCLQGEGRTVAVLAHGLDQIYPPENRALARNILAAGGCLISAYPPGTPPRRGHFPERNRLLAAFSEATVVIEAGPRSGSLITAGFALDGGREVYVVPGPFDAVTFEGSHRLVTEGAPLAPDPQYLLEALGVSSSPPMDPKVAVAQWFEGGEGRLHTLGEIFARSRLPLGEVERQLREGQQAGQVIEVGPQLWVWVG